MKQETLRVDPGSAGERLDRWLAARTPELSRARLQALIESGDVTLDGRATRASAKLKGGETVVVLVPPPRPAIPIPEDIPLRIVHQDPALIVLDKPAGLVVHPGAGRESGTLVNALLHHVKDLSGVGGVLRPGIVHRLDKGTSGLLLVAKDDEAHRSLCAQFASRSVLKEYLAVVIGVPPTQSGRIDSPIGRDTHHRHRMAAGAPRSRPARSDWSLVRKLDGASLLRIRIHTGRTHQIRVHLASIGHPVAGDRVYGGGRNPSCRRESSRLALASLDRLALHAARLEFDHPRSGERLAFESALPEDLARLVDQIGDGS